MSTTFKCIFRLYLVHINNMDSFQSFIAFIELVWWRRTTEKNVRRFFMTTPILPKRHRELDYIRVMYYTCLLYDLTIFILNKHCVRVKT